jgi:hypothetical protein
VKAFDSFSHFLAYGATDQETFRELRDAYDGVLVPATIAAFQREGTGGFVLSLSATEESPPYMIDSRFPLFQQALPKPKKSHDALAELLGEPSLVSRSIAPLPTDFGDERIARIAKSWVEFNTGYGTKEAKKFKKYAARLGEDVTPEQAKGPDCILPPYFACEGPADPWWELSKKLFDATAAVAGDTPCVRVVCGTSATAAKQLMYDLTSAENIVLWISGLDEYGVNQAELLEYRRAVIDAAAAGHETFALYGGFFSVLLGNEGLNGSSHGVGFSEHRNWKELPSSGAPPARYYLPLAHRYVAQDLAQELFNLDPALASCECEHCNSGPPVALDYHELMKHSVYCRAAEIDGWIPRSAADSATRLDEAYELLSSALEDPDLAPNIKARAKKAIEHLPVWVKALRANP